MKKLLEAFLAFKDLKDRPKELTPAMKLELISQLLGGEFECPACGYVEMKPAIITEEEALKLLNEEET